MALSSSNNELVTVSNTKSVISTINCRPTWNHNSTPDAGACPTDLDLHNYQMHSDPCGLLGSTLHDIKEEAVVRELLSGEQGEQAKVSDSRPVPKATLGACPGGKCAAPWDICEVMNSSADHHSEPVSLNFHVQCSNNACNFTGPLHPSCLQRWIALCYLQCQLLSRRTASFSTPHAPGQGEEAEGGVGGNTKETSTTLLLTGLFQLYKCPVCWQPSLCRLAGGPEPSGLAPSQLPNASSTHPSGIITNHLSDPLASVPNAVQYVKQHLTRTLTTQTSPQAMQDYQDFGDFSRLPSSIPSQHLNLVEPGIWSHLEPRNERETMNSLTNGVAGLANSAPPLHSCSESSKFNFDLERKASWQNSPPGYSWTKPTRNVVQTMYKPSMYSKCRTRLSSDSSTSGFVSGSSLQSAEDAYFEFSRRNSLSFCDENQPDSWPEHSECSNQSLYLQFDDLARSLPSDSGALPKDSATAHTNPGASHESSWANTDTALAKLEKTGMKQVKPQLSVPPATEGKPDGAAVTSKGNSADRFQCQAEERRTPTGSNKGREPRQGASAGGRRRFMAVNRKGNIFLQRPDFNVFEQLPAHKRNAYFIYLDDDSCTGNEDTRAFLLAQLTNNNISEVTCLSCQATLPVYDHFPIVDGVFFLSPICHQPGGPAEGIPVHWHSHGLLCHAAPTGSANSGSRGANCEPGERESSAALLARRLFGDQPKPVMPPPGCLGPRQQLSTSEESAGGGGRRAGFSRFGGRQDRYLHALCLACMHEVAEPGPGASKATGRIRCRVCQRPWSGATLLVGGLYTYDIFAATPCCVAHLTCNSCGNPLNNRSLGDTENQPGRATPTDAHQQVQNEVALSDSPAFLPLSFFSQYSQLITCPFCGKVDYHFVKPFQNYYQRSAHRQTTS